MRLGCLKKMRHFLMTHYPAYIGLYVRTQVDTPVRVTSIRIPDVTLQKLEQAASVLRGRGEKLSMHKLRKVSGVHTTYASAYLKTRCM
jgi:hypothetical protein